MRKCKVLFFSRGYGFGHATRDIVIEQELRQAGYSFEILFASYATGYKALRMNGYNPLDLQLPEIGDDDERLLKIGTTIRSEQPSFIISDEELFALPLAKIFGIPSILITNWFPKGKSGINMFNLANCIIFPDIPTSFPVPEPLSKKVHFVGPILRLNRKFFDREWARRAISLDKEMKLVLVTAGGTNLVDIPFFENAINAFNKLTTPAKLIVLAGDYAKMFMYVEKENDNVVVMSHLDEIQKYFLAADIVITRGGHTSLWELAILGTPSIAIPRPKNFNPANELYAISMQKKGTTLFIENDQLHVELLLERMTKILTDSDLWSRMSNAGVQYRAKTGERTAAELIINLIQTYCAMGGKER